MKILRFLLLLSVVISISCSTQFINDYEKPHKKHITERNPIWLYELPVGYDYIVGSAHLSPDSIATQDAAKEMAAVLKSRNTGSYTIQKATQTDSDYSIENGKATFNLNVGDPDEAKRIFNNLNLIDSHKLNNYYIGLFADISSDINDNFKQLEMRGFPKWYRERALDDKQGYITTWAEASSYDLALAWEKAAEKARYQIADYLEKDITAAVINKNDDIKKDIAIETTRKLSHLEITRSYIITEEHDNLYSYKVYLEMKMRVRQ